MATERRTRQYTTYGNVAYQPEFERSAAPSRSRVQRPRREEERTQRPRVQPRPQTVARPNVEVRSQGAIAPFAIIGFAAVILCALLLVMTSARLAMVKDETVELRSTLAELKTEEKTLQAEYELVFDLAAIEQQFTADGSMVRPGAGQTVYLDLSDGDQVIYYDNGGGGLSGLLRQVGDFFGGILS